MPKPRPLTNLASALPTPSDYQSLTPRTPHSRSGRAEEGLTGTDFELQQFNEDDDNHSISQQQSVPLLTSSTSATFPTSGYRSRGDDYGEARTPGVWWNIFGLSNIVSRLPLVAGSILAAIVFILMVLAWERPEDIQKILGISAPLHKTTSSSSASTQQEELSSPKPSSVSGHPPGIISYENYTKFPLLPSEYAAECGKLNQGFMSHGDYWSLHMLLDAPHHDDNHDYQLPEGERTRVCSSTITYMLDGHVGLLADIALVSQAAALARERNRTFLIDDTYWNRGKWTDHFQDIRARQPGPEPGCRAPPPEELVACPRLARHWVVNSRTAKYHFGHGFNNHYEDAYGQQLNRKKPLFDFASESLHSTVRPNAQNALLIRSARSELLQITESQGRDDNANPYVGVHLRRGDRLAQSWAYHKGYVPLADYLEYVQKTWSRLYPELPRSQATVYIASDSPTAHDEFAASFSADAPVFSLFRSKNPDLQTLASPGDYFQEEFNNLKQEQRINATRGMLIDFAILSGAWAWNDDITPAAVVCTMASNVCKLSAVGLGWERAFGNVDGMGLIDEMNKRWVEIDQRGAIRPQWTPFELFN